MKETFTCRLFVLIIIIVIFVQISASDTLRVSDLKGCECNFANSCSNQGKSLENYLPQGVDEFGKPVKHLFYLCEEETVATLFDCNSKIPLYSAAVITEKQLLAGDPRPNVKFKNSKKIPVECQQKNKDYEEFSKLQHCYEERTGDLVVDTEFCTANERPAKRARGKKKEAVPKVHRGHLIASNYFRGDVTKQIATFKYTNAVPQFGSFNSGQWMLCEKRLVQWGKNHCASQSGATNVQMFILVGAVPSTVYGPSKERWFGKKGFSESFLADGHPVNLPELLWTAACCMYEYDDQGKPIQVTKNTAFWGINRPSSNCDVIDIPSLTDKLSTPIKGKVNLFPHSSQSQCKSKDNYVPLVPRN